MTQGLPRQLRIAFLLQVMMASIVIVAGAYASVTVVQHELARQSLEDEASYYWGQRANDISRAAPDGEALHGYAIAAGASAAAVPEALRNLPPGLHSVQDLLVLVQDRGGVRLYLTYSQSLIDRVSWLLVAVPVLLALLAVVASSWFTYRMSRRLVTPVHWLAREVGRWGPMEIDTAALASDQLPADAGMETRQLAGALQRMGDRMRAFVRRERDFTRDASHELRTPLTVIRVASDLMLGDPELPERAHRSLARIQRAGRDMEAVIDAFLILARESDIEPQREDFQVRDVVYEEVGKVRASLAGKPVDLQVVETATPHLYASPRVLGVMLGNLLANACTFTEHGRINVRIEGDRVIVQDSGIGMSAESLQRAYDPFYRVDPVNPTGKGMGLSIVRRLGERFGWPVSLESAPGIGTTATIRFVG
ncbi:MAG TPA: HAMP domain-containing sensor histidine kinase [Luteimonas sp.]|nr:HAMP domain-containing sensor histidine kinase [Luteimonas sp.]